MSLASHTPSGASAHSSSRKQVVILAGGLGTRLRPITEKIPKPMVPVEGEPFLHWQLADLKSQGYTDVLLLVAYLGEQVEAHFGNGARFGMNLAYAYEREPMGTGGALKNALAQLEDEFILLNGDSFLHAPLDRMAEEFDQAEVDALVSTYDNRDPVPVIPNLKVRDRIVLDYKKDAGRAQGFDMIDSGVYVMKRSLVAASDAVRFQLADLWPPLIEAGRLGAFHVPERFYDIGTIDRLKEFETYVKGHLKRL
jgi:NDP-sugar pyrophosphorylase family protein